MIECPGIWPGCLDSQVSSIQKERLPQREQVSATNLKKGTCFHFLQVLYSVQIMGDVKRKKKGPTLIT